MRDARLLKLFLVGNEDLALGQLYEKGCEATLLRPLDYVTTMDVIESLGIGHGPNVRRMLHILMASLLAQLRRGNISMGLSPQNFEEMLRLSGEHQIQFEASEICKHIDSGKLHPFVGGPEDEKSPVVYENGKIQLRRYHATAVCAAEALRNFMEKSASACPEPEKAVLEAGSLKMTSSLNAEQLAAVRSCVRQGFTLITGGPGTGKTSLCAALIQVMVSTACLWARDRWQTVQPRRILLSAPTGRAARKLQESVGSIFAGSGDLEARTLHSCLSRNKGLDRYELIIVDEVFMIDSALMTRFWTALRDDGCQKVVFLGDPDQLPPVGAGRLLKDWLKGQGGLDLGKQRVHLSQGYRSSNDLFAAFEKLRKGDKAWSDRLQRIPDSPSCMKILDDEHRSGIFHWDIDFKSAVEVQELCERWLKNWLNSEVGNDTVRSALGRSELDHQQLQALLSSLGVSKILTATRFGITGSESLNERLRRLLAERLKAGKEKFFHGVPVMVTRNQEAKTLFNGDMGICLKQSGKAKEGASRVRVYFPGGRVADPHGQGEMVPSFSMTVHKSQGGEYRHVILLMSAAAEKLIHREWLYTALTRARQSVLILGSGRLLNLATRLCETG